MKSDAIAFGIAGMLFGLIAGWIIGSQQAALQEPAVPQAPPAAAAPETPAISDEQVKALTTAAEREPNNAEPRVQLANLYFDAQRYGDAIPWYTEALKLAPDNADVSTDLGVSYYYTNQADRALEQFDQSLKIDPNHAKTLLNIGVVKAFGKQDLEGAAVAWKRVVELSPNSLEAQAATRALESLATHPPTETEKPGS
jgi:cytochrome c-type biogenesis protein CcmH/NrfG